MSRILPAMIWAREHSIIMALARWHVWMVVGVCGGACGGQTASPDDRDNIEARDSGAPGEGADDGEPQPDPCGNGAVDPGESCDGTDFAGETCSSVTMGARPYGTLSCGSTCNFDVDSCRLMSGTGGSGGVAGTGGFGGTMGSGGSGGTMGGGGMFSGTGGNAGSSYGDPHLFTADGVEYDFQAVGEFVLFEDTEDPSFVVQVRQQPYRSLPNMSINSAVAARVAGDRVALYAGKPARVLLDGRAIEVVDGMTLPGGGRLEATRETYTVTWPTGEAVVVNARYEQLLNVSYVPSAGSSRKIRGLIGRPDGTRENDFTTRDGRVLGYPVDVDAIYDVFGASYRVGPSESLFDYAPGESTDSFTDLGFPHGSREPVVVTWPMLKDARDICVKAGVTDDGALRACALDVAVTGDPGFARAASPGGWFE